jgi:hypothetical protein
MAVRVTRQTKEILYQETPDVRVTQQYVMVLQCPETALDKSASSTMSLTQNVEATGIPLRESASSTMSLSDDVTLVGVAAVSGSDDLGLTDTAIAVRDIPASASSAITFTSLGGRTLTIEPESDLWTSSSPSSRTSFSLWA